MTCPNCKRLLKRVEQLEKALAKRDKKIAELNKKIADLERRLALYENAHTPPSLRRYPTRQNGGQRTGKRFPGRPKGYPGTTRPTLKPDVVIEAEWDRCPCCGSKLGKPKRVRHRTVEDIPKPPPVVRKRFIEFEGDCKNCGAHIVARHPDCPPSGRFGKNVLVEVTLMKYEERLPHEKIKEALKRRHGLSTTTATVFDITRRVSDWLKPEYEEVRRRVSAAEVVYSDWTGMKVDGKRYWTWDFVTGVDALIAVRRSRSKKVLKENLGKDFSGTVVCDGDKVFPNFTHNIQRCWAHLLCEADWLAEHVDEAKPLQNALHAIYNQLKDALEDDPPPEERARLASNAKRRMLRWLKKRYRTKEVKKFIQKVRNGFNHWFTFVTTPGIEPTNNRAERVLREHVVQRKIIGTLRNEKGAAIYEIMMTMLATWKLRGLNPAQALSEALTTAWSKSFYDDFSLFAFQPTPCFSLLFKPPPLAFASRQGGILLFAAQTASWLFALTGPLRLNNAANAAS